MLKIQMLGQTTFILNGKVKKDFLSEKVMALLCFVIQNAGENSRQMLAVLLWGEMDDERAKSNLRQALHDLRRWCSDYLIISRKTVKFDRSKPYELDLEQFVDKLGSPGKAAEAVELYRGEFLQGLSIDSTVEFEGWLREQREHFRLLLLQAFETLITEAEKAMDWEAVVRWTRQGVSIEPWREEFYQKQMLALARQGRFNEALSQYDHCVQILSVDLSVEPVPTTTEVYKRILRAREGKRHNLPAEGTRFVGRETELRQLNERLRQSGCRLITLVGPGGIGKTRLALALAHQQIDQFINGVTFVPLIGIEVGDSLNTEEHLILAIANSLNVTFTKPNLRQELLSYLATEERLFVLDNFEHMRPAASFLVTLLQEAPNIKLLLTSRERVGISAESLWMVNGLSHPVSPTINPLMHDAIQFFNRVAKRVQPSFSLEAQIAAVVQLCKLVDGYPLALELAASWLRLMPTQEIVEELQQSLDVLTTASPDRDDRHSNMRSVLASSWQKLNSEEQEAMRQLVVFRNGFTRKAASEVAKVSLSWLNVLVDRSFLYADGTGRFEVHELMKQYIQELPDYETDLVLRRRHAIYYLDFLHRQTSEITRQTLPSKAEVIGREIDNILAGWRWTVQNREWPRLAKAVVGLNKIYEGRGWYLEGETLFGTAVADLWNEAQLLTGADQIAWGQFLSHYTLLLLRLGQSMRALELATESVTILKLHDDRMALGFALNQLGIAQIYEGNFAEAEVAFQDSLSLYRQLGHDDELVKPLANLGGLFARLGNYASAIATLNEGLDLCHRINDRHGQSFFLTNLGATYLQLGEIGQARLLFEKSLPICEEMDNQQGKALILSNLGEISVRDERWMDADNQFAEAISILRTLNDQRNLARILRQKTIVSCQINNLQLAKSHLRESLHLVQNGVGVPVTLEVLYAGAYWLWKQNHTETATEIALQVLEHPALEEGIRVDVKALLSEMGVRFRLADEIATGLSLEEIASKLLRML